MADLDDLVDRLVEGYQPDRVVLCPGAGRDAGPLELLVVKRTEQRFLARREEALRGLPSAAVDLLVYTPEEIEEMSRRENPFVILALEEGVVLYPRS